MLEWAREAAHRLLRSQEASLKTGGEIGERLGGGTRNSQASPRGPTGAFDRFLRDFQARNDEAFREHTPGGRVA
jgi:hypothetical protein